MALTSPYWCEYHDWHGFGRCPYCREERYAAMEHRHELKLLNNPLTDKQASKESYEK